MNETRPTLTGREREVLLLLSKGMKIREIGELLGISAHTAVNHIRHIYGKLAVRSRSEAVYEALDLGLCRVDLHPQSGAIDAVPSI